MVILSSAEADDDAEAERQRAGCDRARTGDLIDLAMVSSRG